MRILEKKFVKLLSFENIVMGFTKSLNSETSFLGFGYKEGEEIVLHGQITERSLLKAFRACRVLDTETGALSEEILPMLWNYADNVYFPFIDNTSRQEEILAIQNEKPELPKLLSWVSVLKKHKIDFEIEELIDAYPDLPALGPIKTYWPKNESSTSIVEGLLQEKLQQEARKTAGEMFQDAFIKASDGKAPDFVGMEAERLRTEIGDELTRVLEAPEAPVDLVVKIGQPKLPVQPPKPSQKISDGKEKMSVVKVAVANAKAKEYRPPTAQKKKKDRRKGK